MPRTRRIVQGRRTTGSSASACGNLGSSLAPLSQTKGQTGTFQPAHEPLKSDRLENNFQSQLDESRIVQRTVDHSKTRRAVHVLHGSGAGARQVEVGMVKQVEELRAELHVSSFPEREREVLDN